MQRKESRQTAAWCCAALVAFSLALADWRHPVIRLTSPHANVLALWILLWGPWIAGVTALVRLRRAARLLVGFASLGGIVVGFFPLLFVTLGVASLGTDSPSLGAVPLERIPLPRGGELVVYDAGCGAPCGLDFEVRQEREILPGVRLVRVLYWSDANLPSVELLDPGRARIDRDTVGVRRWVYP